MSLRELEKWLPVAPLVPLLFFVPLLRDSVSYFDCPVGSMVLICSLELLFCYLVVMCTNESEVRYLSPQVVILLLVWGGAGLLAVAEAELVFPAIARQTEWFAHILFALYFSFYLRINPRVNVLLPYMILAGFMLVAFQLLSSWYSTVLPHEQKWANLIPGFRNIRFFGFYIVPAIFFPLFVLFKNQGKGVRLWPIFLYISFCWAFLVWSGGRGLFLSLCVTIFLWRIVIEYPRWNWLLKVLGGSAMLGIIMAMQFSVPGQSLLRLPSTDITLDGFSSSRISIWHEALLNFLNHPWLGLGPDGYAYLQPKIMNGLFHPHNIILQFLGDWGMIGTVAAGMLITIGLRNIVVNIREDDDPDMKIYRTTSLGVVTCLLFLSMLSGSFYYPFSLLFVAIAFAVGLQESPGLRRPSGLARGFCCVKKNVFGRGCICLLAFIVLLHGTIFGLQFGRIPSSPVSIRAQMVYWFPSSLEGEGVLRWIRAWQEDYPEAAYSWSLWAQQRSRAKWYYYLIGAEILMAQGNRGEAENSLRQALELCPKDRDECLKMSL